MEAKGKAGDWLFHTVALPGTLGASISWGVLTNRGRRTGMPKVEGFLSLPVLPLGPSSLISLGFLAQ